MEDKFNPERFYEAQAYSYESALQELRNGRKTTHWMWYIFPQLRGLGRSEMSNFYGISGTEEAAAYLGDPMLGTTLREVCEAILGLETNDAREVFGDIDSHKLLSSMTLFDLISPDDIFDRVLQKYFNGRRCRRTLERIRN